MGLGIAGISNFQLRSSHVILNSMALYVLIWHRQILVLTIRTAKWPMVSESSFGPHEREPEVIPYF